VPVERVVDGDTVIVLRDGAEERVRLLGIDTPESVKPDSPVECFGPEASARTAELLTGRSVWLENDPTQATVDQYGRTLAYAWLDESTLVNLVLVAEGYAYEYTYDVPGVHQAALAAAQDEASAAGLGLWGAC
jgi:micrococcal nuclease